VAQTEERTQIFFQSKVLIKSIVEKKDQTARINQEIMKIETVITTGFQDLAAKTKFKISVKMAQQMFRYLQTNRKADKE